MGRPPSVLHQTIAHSVNTSRMSRQAVFEDAGLHTHARLHVQYPDGHLVIVDMGEGEYSVGRGVECQVQLLLPNVSRTHAVIAFRHDDYYLRDLQSTNGTYVNGVRVCRCVLRNNDQIQIGEARLHFIEERTRQTLP